jgi:cysteine-rich repeat protein
MRLTTFQMFALLVAGCATHHDGDVVDENCGNGVYDPNEQCEPSLDGPACEKCIWGGANHCGNGVLEQGEQCDDGNRLAGDGCLPDCQLEHGVGCPAADFLTCTKAITDTTDSPHATSMFDSYLCLDGDARGVELIYELVAPSDGRMVVSLTTVDAPPGSVHALVMQDAVTCAMATCVAAGASSVSFTAVKDHRYLVVVDTALNAKVAFTVGINCAPP